jgi:hypothetical protein
LSDEIPIIALHRGIGLHDQQEPPRLDLVRREIDQVFEIIDDPQELFEIAGNFLWAPESRLFASAKLKALHELNTEERVARSGIDLTMLRARVAGLNSLRWRNPVYFCSALDAAPAPGAPGPVRRERVLWRD